jgi:hypothetical protein
MNSQLNNKFAVLYVTKEGAGNQRALEISQSLPEIHIQDVALLTQEQIPSWLKEVPTCVIISNKQIYVGTNALKLLAEIRESKQKVIKEQFANPVSVNNQFAPSASQQSSQYMQQQYTAQMEGRLYSPQQRQNNIGTPQHTQAQPQLNYQRQQIQNTIPQVQTTIPQVQTTIPQVQTTLPQFQQVQNLPPQVQHTPQSTGDVVLRGSLLPASGTGNYGCSLDAAFEPTNIVPEQIVDPRMTASGKVNQNDIQSYMQMREQSGKIPGGRAQMLQQ